MDGTLVVGDLIDSARDEHPTFNDRRHPDPVLIRALSRYQKELLGKIIRADSTQAVESFDQAMPLAVFENGIAIPAYKYPLGVLAMPGRGHRHPIDLVPWEESAIHHYSAYLLNGILFLTGKARHWVGVTSVRFLYVPQTAALAMARTTVLTALPDSAEPTLVAFLAMKMGTRGGAGNGEKEPNAAGFASGWTMSEDRFIDEMVRNTQAVVSRVREVF